VKGYEAEMTDAQLLDLLESVGAVPGRHWRLINVDGKTEIMVNQEGVHRLATASPNQQRAQAFVRAIDEYCARLREGQQRPRQSYVRSPPRLEFRAGRSSARWPRWCQDDPQRKAPGHLGEAGMSAYVVIHYPHAKERADVHVVGLTRVDTTDRPLNCISKLEGKRVKWDREPARGPGGDWVNGLVDGKRGTYVVERWDVSQE
jgi:hypothetical protein